MLSDNFHRKIDYMRVSITDRCNLRCIYCMPPQGLAPIEHKEILSYEEIMRVLRSAVKFGVRKIRITGGEPLVRKNITHLIKLIKEIEGIEDLSMTTNGVLLENYAEELSAAGLNRINVSLDSLKPEKYAEITRGGELNVVLQGIEAAEIAGLKPVKINMVPIRGINDNEIIDFAKLTEKHDYQVRFIEFMPFGTEDLWTPERFISADEMKTIVEHSFKLAPVKMKKSGPARYFRFEGASGVIGFITPLSNHFCKECNRLRLTADGKLRPCLFSETEIDLKPALRGGASDSEIERLITLAVAVKPEGHTLDPQSIFLQKGIFPNNKGCESLNPSVYPYKRPMSKIGG